MLTEYFKLRPSNWKPTFRDIFCNRNEPKQSINTAWQITEVPNSAKQRVEIPKTERLMYGCHEPCLLIFTHNLALSGSSRLLRRYAMPLLRLPLGNLSTRRFLRGDGNRKSNLLPIHVSRRQGPPSRLRADFVLLILTSPVKREFRYYDFRAFISFCLQYFAHSDTQNIILSFWRFYERLSSI